MGKAPTATITLSDPAPSYGETITATVVISPTPEYGVEILFVAKQDGVPVAYGGGIVHRGAEVSESFTLSGAGWPGGAADCTIRVVEVLQHSRFRTLESLEFVVTA